MVLLENAIERYKHSLDQLFENLFFDADLSILYECLTEDTIQPQDEGKSIYNLKNFTYLMIVE